MVSIERKHLTALQMHLPVRFMVLTNETPRIGDASGALASRFMVLQFTGSFLGKEDTGRQGRLLSELPGILLWALEGLARPNARGHFVQPASAEESIQQLQELGSPVKAFVRDRCEVGTDKAVERGALYRAWCSWCKEAGHYEISRETFGRDLAAAVTDCAWSSGTGASAIAPRFLSAPWRLGSDPGDGRTGTCPPSCPPGQCPPGAPRQGGARGQRRRSARRRRGRCR
jgi:phage/plasmid-associated DNA primase